MTNAHKLLDSLKNPIWWVQKTTGIPHIIYYAAHACTVTLKKIFPITCEVVFVFCKDEHLEWAYEEHDLAKAASYLIDQTAKDYDFIKGFYKKWKAFYDEFIDFCNKIDKTDLSALDQETFLKYYQEFTEKYEKEYSLSMLCDHFSFYAERELKNKLSQKEFSTLTTPSIISFVSEEEISLLNMYNKGDKAIQDELDTHVKKFFWILNTYRYPKILDREYFIEKIKEWQEENIDADSRLKELLDFKKNIQQKKEAMLSKLELDKRSLLIIKLIDVFAEMHDLRKRANLMGSHYAYIFLKEVSVRSEVSMETLKYVTPPEIEGVIKTKEVDKKLIEAKKTNWLIFFTGKKIETLDSKEADKLYQEMFKHKDDITEIKGVTASPGKVKGRVKIIFHTTEANKMEKGDILVASMTRPDYMTAIHKAKAIVTDEGGVTCHAAIISRELNIPCIIATKNATRILKDDDYVEVDANKGVVRRVKK